MYSISGMFHIYKGSTDGSWSHITRHCIQHRSWKAGKYRALASFSSKNIFHAKSLSEVLLIVKRSKALMCIFSSDKGQSHSLTKFSYGPLARYVILRVAHVPGMPWTFSPLPLVSDPDMHHGACVTHASWCMPGSLTSSFLWSRWRGKRSRHSWRMHNLQFYVFGKGPIAKNASNISFGVHVGSTAR